MHGRSSAPSAAMHAAGSGAFRYVNILLLQKFYERCIKKDLWKFM